MSEVLDIPEGYIRVLDKGYVGYRNHMGDDNGPADAARVSFKKRAVDFTDEQNLRLVNYLLKNDEFACFRHDTLKIEVHAPLMIARQWWKYAVASAHVEDQRGWNESSRRYITEENEYNLPQAHEWRSAPENKKQGSDDAIPTDIGASWTADLERYQQIGETLYQAAMDQGIAPEQARLFLPAYGLYVSWIWTASLQTLSHFLKERLDDHAQYEIRLFAQAVLEIVKEYFPGVIKLFLEHEGIEV